MEEEIAKGQNVLAYVVEAMVNGEWHQITEGRSIGRKRIERFDLISTTCLRLRVTQALKIPTIRFMAAYSSSK